MGIFKNDDQKSSQFGFDEKSMAGKAVKAVRWIYAITGVLALVAGIALLFAPAKSLVFLTTVLGFYFVITAAIRLFTAVFEPLLPTGWRVTSIISNLLIILGGVIILRNQAFSTATLTTMVVIVAGFGWIVEGVMSILESELSSNRALAILSGALSIIAGMFVLYGEQYAQILEQFGEACGMGADEVANETAEVRKTIAEVREATLTAGWDGAWFRRAYDANGNPVGTNEDSEGKIYIEPQGMCVMAGIGVDDGKAAKALESTKELLTCRWGTAILAPAYSTYRIELGEISSYPRGYKENGGIFCHNNPWISIANAKINNNDEAFNVYKRTCPAYTEEYSEIHRTEPYVYCQMVAGPEAPTPGEGKNSWLTGTAAWTFVDVSQHLLGVQPTFDGLKIEPHLPPNFGELHIERTWRGTRYIIDVTRTGEQSLTVDGQPVSGTVVPTAATGTEEVHVALTI